MAIFEHAGWAADVLPAHPEAGPAAWDDPQFHHPLSASRSISDGAPSAAFVEFPHPVPS